MMGSRQKGFTIIESMLVMAISASIILIVISAFSGRTSAVQFTDAIRSLESIIKQRYNYVRTGVAANPGGCSYVNSTYNFGAVSDGTCINLGYVIEFALPTSSDRSQINVYQMYGARLSPEAWSSCSSTFPNDPLYCVNPQRNTAQSPESIIIPWKTDFIGNSNYSRAFAFLRNPKGSTIIPMIYKGSGAYNLTTLYNDRNAYLASDIRTDIGSEAYQKYCFLSIDDNRRAAISIGDSIETSFDDIDYCGGLY